MVGTNYYTQVTSTLWIAFNDGVGATHAKCVGTPPTTAGLFQHGCEIIQTDGAGGTVGVFTNTGTLAAPVWLNASGVVNSAAAGVGPSNTAHAIYSFAVDGGAISTITPVQTALLPIRAVIVASTINVTTACTSGGSATVAVGTTAGSSTTSLLGATAVASLTTGALINGAATFAAPVKLTAAGSIDVTIAVAALTAGIIEVFATYYVAAN